MSDKKNICIIISQRLKEFTNEKNYATKIAIISADAIRRTNKHKIRLCITQCVFKGHSVGNIKIDTREQINKIFNEYVKMDNLHAYYELWNEYFVQIACTHVKVLALI
jgi:hypothetical protein